ncbi:MAG TPA: MarR family winged helix-turn-helix transcriptional regulator [Roseomonas sp.]|jgi:DNA-binding MarR family transcriptional regulator
MPQPATLPPQTVALIGETCLCRRVQRAGRVIGRHFDEAFRHLGLNNWQFTLLMALHMPGPPTVNDLAVELGMDRTTMTRNLRPLERRGLLGIHPDAEDGRVRRIVLTEAGRALLAQALPHWRAANAAIAARLPDEVALAGFRFGLDAIAQD